MCCDQNKHRVQVTSKGSILGRKDLIRKGKQSIVLQRDKWESNIEDVNGEWDGREGIIWEYGEGQLTLNLILETIWKSITLEAF